MKVLFINSLIFLTLLGVFGCSSTPSVTFIEKENQIDVMIDGKLFTSYLYGPELPKPILYPVYSPSGEFMTRHFPPLEGETQDHPHHSGIFFTYDEVNDSNPHEKGSYGYWNNPKPELPYIKHVKVTDMRTENGKGILSVVLHWIGRDSTVHLEEQRTMTFIPGKTEHTIDFGITLTAMIPEVVFHDTKEGMFGMRVADWLSEKNGTGRYLSSHGTETEKEVWGLRHDWVRLEGEKDGKKLGFVIMNHPTSTNYPCYWHARSYGLFAANPLGQFAFEKGRKVENPQHFNFTLKEGESAPFRFRVVVYEGSKSKPDLDAAFKNYVQ